MVQEALSQTLKVRKDFDIYVQNCYGFKNDEERTFVRKAFSFAFQAHKGMVRHSGAPFITHSFEVAKIVTRTMGLGTKSAAAALLADVIDKTEYDIEDIRRHLGSVVCNIVQSLQKIKESNFFSDNSQASQLREILLSISDDIRVIMIKLADRLHNLRTLEFNPPDKQKQIVNEVLVLYAPLAHRLGLYNIKSEMEDLCMKFDNRDVYNDISQKIKHTERELLQFINRFIQPVNQVLDKNNLKYTIKSRTKSIYSIYKKMQNKKVSFEEVYDLFAIRIIFENENEQEETKNALQIAELITEIYAEKEDRRRNWLYDTKETGYQALHLTVLSNEGKWVEVQIRSKKMDEAAEFGMAAHWKYKGLNEKKNELTERIAKTLQQLNEHNENALEFLDNLKLNIFTTEIFVFTPHSHVITLPKNSTVLDFAFKIHTKLALKSIAAKINGKTKTLDTILHSGDKVQMITSHSQYPKPEWLNFVITQKAIRRLKEHFKKKEIEIYETGKAGLTNLLNELSIPENDINTTKILNFFRVKDKKELYNKIYIGEISTDISDNKIATIFEKKTSELTFTKIQDTFKIFKRKSKNQEVHNSDNYIFEKADCCNPQIDDDLKGYRRKDNKMKIIVHKKKCEQTSTNQEIENPIPIICENYTTLAIAVGLHIKGTDTKGFVNKVTSVISNDMSVNLRSIYFQTEGKAAEGEVVLCIRNEDYIEKIINRLKKIESVSEIEIIPPYLRNL